MSLDKNSLVFIFDEEKILYNIYTRSANTPCLEYISWWVPMWPFDDDTKRQFIAVYIFTL